MCWKTSIGTKIESTTPDLQADKVWQNMYSCTSCIAIIRAEELIKALPYQHRSKWISQLQNNALHLLAIIISPMSLLHHGERISWPFTASSFISFAHFWPQIKKSECDLLRSVWSGCPLLATGLSFALLASCTRDCPTSKYIWRVSFTPAHLASISWISR